MEQYKLIGDRLKQAREDKEYSLDDVSKLIHLSKSTLSRYENGLVENMKIPILKSLADIYKVDYLWLIGKSEKKEIKKTIPEYFTSAKEAMKFMLNQTVVMGFNGLDITKLSEEEQIQYANDMLDMMKLVSLKYKDKK